MPILVENSWVHWNCQMFWQITDIRNRNRIESLFPNLSVSLRMFLIAPATAASVERSFSKLLVKNYLRSTMSQDHLTNLARLSIESDIAKQIDFDNVICSFTNKTACKAMLF